MRRENKSTLSKDTKNVRKLWSLWLIYFHSEMRMKVWQMCVELVFDKLTKIFFSLCFHKIKIKKLKLQSLGRRKRQRKNPKLYQLRAWNWPSLPPKRFLLVSCGKVFIIYKTNQSLHHMVCYKQVLKYLIKCSKII